MPSILKLTLLSGSLIGKVGRIGTGRKERQDRINPPPLERNVEKKVLMNFLLVCSIQMNRMDGEGKSHVDCFLVFDMTKSGGQLTTGLAVRPKFLFFYFSSFIT